MKCKVEDMEFVCNVAKWLQTENIVIVDYMLLADVVDGARATDDLPCSTSDSTFDQTPLLVTLCPLSSFFKALCKCLKFGHLKLTTSVVISERKWIENQSVFLNVAFLPPWATSIDFLL